MSDQRVPVIRTVVTPSGYARAVLAAWPLVEAEPCLKSAVGVLHSQYMIETGGTASWNWNLGNVKYTPGAGTDYMCLSGVWEGVSPGEAARLIAAGEATADASADHRKAVNPSGDGTRVSVIFQPPHPATRFRAYPSLADGMIHHLKTLRGRFKGAWPYVLSGEPEQTAIALRAQGYYTASAQVYGAAMRRFYDAFMRSDAYEQAQDDTPTQPQLPSPPPSPASEPTIHVDKVPHWHFTDENPRPIAIEDDDEAD